MSDLFLKTLIEFRAEMREFRDEMRETLARRGRKLDLLIELMRDPSKRPAQIVDRCEFGDDSRKRSCYTSTSRNC